MKKINITITGALGRMGKILIKRISKNKNLKLFSLTDIKSGKTINGIKIRSEVLIDFILQ
jgi:4-hydroxy-tetrahydrodipicolinate reductase